jgi:plasmid stabilization system protein ParE
MIVSLALPRQREPPGVERVRHDHYIHLYVSSNKTCANLFIVRVRHGNFRLAAWNNDRKDVNLI